MNKYRVWCPNEGQDSAADGETFEAIDAEHAAQQWAEWSDWSSAEYSIASGTPEMVIVTDDNGDEKQFEVDGEVIPSYSASQTELSPNT